MEAVDLGALAAVNKRNMAIVTAKYIPEWLDSVVPVLADAFVTNPLHISAFGPDRIDQNRLFFRIGLEHMFTGHAFVALVDGKVQGYVHFNTPPRCLPPPGQMQAVAGTFLKPLGDAAPRVTEWFSTWCRLDPKEPHAHLGPIGVAPAAQGTGVGRALMNRYLEYLKQKRAAGYLETDRPENVDFYRKFGFVVQREETLIGAQTWYMWRERDE